MRNIDTSTLVQVFFGPDLVGHLNESGRSCLQRVDLVVHEDDSDGVFSSLTSQFVVPLEGRHFRITAHETQKLSPGEIEAKMRKHHVPAYAEPTKLAYIDAIELNWRVIAIHESHRDMFERLFDNDRFVPLDELNGKDEHQVANTPWSFSAAVASISQVKADAARVNWKPSVSLPSFSFRPTGS